MTTLRSVLQSYVSNGSVPGAVALVARGDQVEVQAVGFADADGTSPMASDSILRVASITKPIVASITKPITAAAVLMLVEDGQIALDDPSGTGCRSWRRRLFGPLGMADTGFEVSAGKLDRLTSYYRTDPAGGVELVDAPDGPGVIVFAAAACGVVRIGPGVPGRSGTPAGRHHDRPKRPGA